VCRLIHIQYPSSFVARLDLSLILIARTGFGKSLVFQAVALLRGGVTLIITPLLAIEEEQVADLKKLGGFAPVALNGLTNTPKLLQDIQNGLYSHIFLSPEIAV